MLLLQVLCDCAFVFPPWRGTDLSFGKEAWAIVALLVKESLIPETDDE